MIFWINLQGLSAPPAFRPEELIGLLTRLHPLTLVPLESYYSEEQLVVVIKLPSSTHAPTGSRAVEDWSARLLELLQDTPIPVTKPRSSEEAESICSTYRDSLIDVGTAGLLGVSEGARRAAAILLHRERGYSRDLELLQRAFDQALGDQQRALLKMQEDLSVSERKLESLERSRAWRLCKRALALQARVLPEGSPRREAAKKLFHFLRASASRLRITKFLKGRSGGGAPLKLEPVPRTPPPLRRDTDFPRLALEQPSYTVRRVPLLLAWQCNAAETIPSLTLRALINSFASGTPETMRALTRLRSLGTRVIIEEEVRGDLAPPWSERCDGMDMLVLIGSEFPPWVDEVIGSAHRFSVPTVLLREGGQALRPWELTRATQIDSVAGDDLTPAPTTRWTHHGIAPAPQALRSSRDLADFLSQYAATQLPTVSVVSVLYAKERELPYFIEAFKRQTYQGALEFIFVDDKSPDGSAALAEELLKEWSKSSSVRWSILRNDENLGNCTSRNRGIAAASGEVLVVVDADVVVNRTFIERHVETHRLGCHDVVIGPHNLETQDEQPLTAVRRFELNPVRVSEEAELQDTLHRASFLNCITRNFSIRRSFVTEPLFDPLFSYSKHPNSGFGWEDVEMGYRLYLRGARIAFIPDAFSVHVSHPPSVEESSKPLRSMLNFRRLLEKHPLICVIARRWVHETFHKITSWCDQHGHARNDDRLFVEAQLTPGGPDRSSASWPLLKTEKKLRIISYRWHSAHQYELYKLGHEVTLLKGIGTPWTERWEYNHRPMPPNAHFEHIDDVKLSEYDLALLHFDENVLAPENCNGVLEGSWGDSFKWLRQNLQQPAIAVCHGTPQFVGQYNIGYRGADLGQVIEEERRRLVSFLGEIPVVTNSYQAGREWQFLHGTTIWHGFDPTEYPSSTYERGALALGSSMKERPHYRGYFLYQEILKRLPQELHPAPLRIVEPDFALPRESNEYAAVRFRAYVDAIRCGSIYVNPTIRSPMPRSRAEAMLCGLVTVSASNHDVEMFIKNGANGFHSNAPEELAEFLIYLSRDPQRVREIGARGRESAAALFNHDRYLAQWRTLIADTLALRRAA